MSNRKHEVKAISLMDGSLVAEIYQLDGRIWLSNGLEAVQLTSRQVGALRAMLRDQPDLARVVITEPESPIKTIDASPGKIRVIPADRTDARPE